MKGSFAIQILPERVEDKEVIRIVDKVIDYIKSTGLNYYVGPFETTIEGDDINELFEIMKNSFLIASKENPNGISSYIKIYFRENREVLSIEEKVSKHH